MPVIVFPNLPVDLSHNLYQYDNIIPIKDDSKMKEICTAKKVCPHRKNLWWGQFFFLKISSHSTYSGRALLIHGDLLTFLDQFFSHQSAITNGLVTGAAAQVSVQGRLNF